MRGRSEEHEQLGPYMSFVIICKAITGILLLVGFVFLVRAGKEEPADFFTRTLLELFKGNPPALALNLVISKTELLSSNKAFLLAGAALTYAVLELIEAAGLWRRQEWAEWLTVFVTASFIPFEVYELAKEPTALKAVMLALNGAILVYLVVRRVKAMKSKGRSPGFSLGSATA